jgi:hypothetical protein
MIAKPTMPTRDRLSGRPHASVRVTRLLDAVTLASLLALAACATPVAPTVAADGDYRGSSTRFQALRRTCPRPGLLHLPVRSATLFYPWAGQYIQVSILNNGTLAGALPGVRLTGTHDATVIQGDVTDGQCGLHFTLTRVSG